MATSAITEIWLSVVVIWHDNVSFSSMSFVLGISASSGLIVRNLEIIPAESLRNYMADIDLDARLGIGVTVCFIGGSVATGDLVSIGLVSAADQIDTAVGFFVVGVLIVG